MAGSPLPVAIDQDSAPSELMATPRFVAVIVPSALAAHPWFDSAYTMLGLRLLTPRKNPLMTMVGVHDAPPSSLRWPVVCTTGTVPGPTTSEAPPTPSTCAHVAAPSTDLNKPDPVAMSRTEPVCAILKIWLCTLSPAVIVGGPTLASLHVMPESVDLSTT